MKSIKSIVFGIAALVILSVGLAQEQIPGGLSPGEKLPTETINGFMNTLKDQINSKSPSKFKSLKPLSYKDQVVAGMNYYVKVQAKTEDDSESIIHVKIYKHFGGTARVISVLHDKKLESPIQFFD